MFGAGKLNSAEDIFNLGRLLGTLGAFDEKSTSFISPLPEDEEDAKLCELVEKAIRRGAEIKTRMEELIYDDSLSLEEFEKENAALWEEYRLLAKFVYENGTSKQFERF